MRAVSLLRTINVLMSTVNVIRALRCISTHMHVTHISLHVARYYILYLQVVLRAIACFVCPKCFDHGFFISYCDICSLHAININKLIDVFNKFESEILLADTYRTCIMYVNTNERVLLHVRHAKFHERPKFA